MIEIKNLNINNLSERNIMSSIAKELSKRLPKDTFNQSEYLFCLFTNKQDEHIIQAKKNLLTTLLFIIFLI